jgi:hypothetical protein
MQAHFCRLNTGVEDAKPGSFALKRKKFIQPAKNAPFSLRNIALLNEQHVLL